MKQLIFILGMLVATATRIVAQQSIMVSQGDIVRLEADDFNGDIQWQFSGDLADWADIDGGTTSLFDVVADQPLAYYRARIDREGCDQPHFSEVIQVASDVELSLWSDPDTWGGDKPGEGDQVLIPADKYILLDESPPTLGGITIEGTLEFDRQDLSLSSKWIVVHGLLRIGNELDPFVQRATVTLTDADQEASIMDMGTRGIVVMGGRLELHGATPGVVLTRLEAHAEKGATVLQLGDEVGWLPDDEIIVTPTDYYEAAFGASVTQRVKVQSVIGREVTLAEGLNAHRWGLLQYATGSGMSLSPTGMVEPPTPDTETHSTPLVLDERAEVALLTRNIVIQAPDDEAWQNDGFGVHTMIMPGSEAHVSGVEFRRAGQKGRQRRYPFHWHILSYSGQQTLGDAEEQYIRNSVINTSANRGIVIHGTNGVSVQNNIVYNVRGHGIFTEDAVERRNVIDANLVAHVRNPDWGFELKQHEVGDLGSSGFWISNPDNTVTNNISADCQTFGFWLSFPAQPVGLSRQVLHSDGMLLRPNRLQFGVFDNNTAHSNRNDGIHLDDAEIDDEGNTAPLQYWSTTDGRSDSWPFEALRRFSLSRYKTWKNQDNGAWDRAVWTDIFEVVSADNCGRFFAGSGSEGVIERSLVVGTSLNYMMNGTGRPEIADFQFNSSSAPSAFATYHSTFSMNDNVIVNFQVEKHDRAGVFASDDYYLRPVDKGHVRNNNNLLILSHPGVKLKASYDYFTLASALWDPNGLWGPAGNYLVYDDLFLTYDKEVTVVAPGTDVVGGVSVPGPFYGFLSFVLHGVGDEPPGNQPFFDLMAIQVSRLDEELNEVASWSVSAAQPDWTLQHMRDFATTPEGIYELTFPNQPTPPTDFQMSVENMTEPEDQQVIGIQYDGTLSPAVYLQQESDLNNYQVYEQLSSLQEVIDSNGETWWQDKPNNRVWVKLKGGLWRTPQWAELPDDFEDSTNETMLLKIREPD